MTIYAEPGSNMTLELIINYVNPSTNQPYFGANHLVPVMVRECLAGESFTEMETCQKCVPGTYLNETGLKEARPCKACVNEAICLGGNVMAPKLGFWRANNETLNFMTCIN